jgi:hypothetical protein
MDPKRWSKPLTFQSQAQASPRTIVSTSEAVSVLANNWPIDRGRSLKRAKKACRDVMDGKRPPSEARSAFIAAAVEANIFVREK